MSERKPVGRVIGVNVRDDELVVRCFGSADASLLHEVLSVARPEPVGEPVAIAWLEVRQNREVKVRLSDTQKAEAIYQSLLHGDGGDVSLPLYAAPPAAPEATRVCATCHKPIPPDSSVWMVERDEPADDGRPLWLRWMGKGEGLPEWTTDPNAADHYCSAISASQEARYLSGQERWMRHEVVPCSVTEHGWVAAPEAQEPDDVIHRLWKEPFTVVPPVSAAVSPDAACGISHPTAGGSGADISGGAAGEEEK